MKTLVFFLTFLALPALAADSVACYRQCAAQGNDQSYCMTVCERNGGGITPQQGVPRNPYLDALPDPAPKEKPQRRVEPKCVDRCVDRGYNYNYCRKQCAY